MSFVGYGRMLAERGDAELNAKVQFVRHLLTEIDSIVAIRASPQRLLGAVVDHLASRYESARAGSTR